MSTRVLLRAVARNLYFDSHCHSLQFECTYRGAPCIKYVNWGYQNKDQSVSLIPKWDPGITNFSIPDTGIENPILGLQSLIVAEGAKATAPSCPTNFGLSKNALLVQKFS